MASGRVPNTTSMRFLMLSLCWRLPCPTQEPNRATLALLNDAQTGHVMRVQKDSNDTEIAL